MCSIHLALVTKKHEILFFFLFFFFFFYDLEKRHVQTREKCMSMR